jgi:hypothetical protein
MQIRLLAWVTIGAVAWLVGAVAAFVPLVLFEQLVLGPAGIEPEVGTSGWGVRLAIHPIAWSALATAAALVAARALGVAIAWRPLAVAVPAVGTGVAAILEFAIHEWERERFGMFDTEYVGVASLAPGSVVAVALAGWALHAGPGPGSPLLRVVAVLAAVSFAAIGILQMAGLDDGLRPSSIPLASSLVVAAAYVGLVVLSALRWPHR